MKKQSKWIICGFESKSEKWLVIGNMAPVLSPDKFYTAIERYRKQFTHFGVWVVPHDWSMQGVIAPDKSVRSIDEIFIDNQQINQYQDILDGMVFVHNKSGVMVIVLASRDEYVMYKEVGGKPGLMHWRKLIGKFNLNATLLR